MSTLQVQTNSSAYPIYIEKGFQALPKAVLAAGLASRKLFVITDSNVAGLYLDSVKTLLGGLAREVHTFIFPAGEAQKNLNTVSQIYEAMLEKRLDRKSVVIALGGGVAGDIAGFAAATFLRGIDFVQIPTTLLSQVDSSVGGKVGVDFQGSKNLIGAFYQPRFVYTNVDTLTTLPEKEYRSGLGEVIKHGLILDKSYYEMLHEQRTAVLNREPRVLEDIVHGSCVIKSAIVRQDEKEQGVRALLNFGHTFGHAIESLSDFALGHGQCVAMGCLSAMYLSSKYGKIPGPELGRLRELYGFFKMDTGFSGMDTERLYDQMLFDKKIENNRLRFILLDGVGKAYIEESGLVTKDDIMDAFAYITK